MTKIKKKNENQVEGVKITRPWQLVSSIMLFSCSKKNI